VTPGQRPAPGRTYGPDVGEPPVLVDPRRIGSLVGLVGGMVFVGSYSAALGPVVSAVAWAAGLVGVAGALIAHYVRPVPLGPLPRLSPVGMLIYLACVAGELALIAAGSRALLSADRGELQPALIATVVGLHFIPFALAFRERMFYLLGGAVAAVGAAGLLVGAIGVSRAADAAAVLAGLVMIALIRLYARGRFAPAPREPAAT
jgi:hypothetical protein